MHPLRKYREKKDISQASLGELVGVSKAQISRIETGESRASPALATKLEGITKIPKAHFIFGDGRA